jgi:hypothetical protein
MPLFLVPSVGIRRREGLVKNGVTKLLKFVWFSVLIQKYESVIRLSSFLAKKIKKKVKKMNKFYNSLVDSKLQTEMK